MLYLLQRRLKNGDIYTWAGDVLISLNPYSPIASLYQALALLFTYPYPYSCPYPDSGPCLMPPALSLSHSDPLPLAPAPTPAPCRPTLRLVIPIILDPYHPKVSTFLDGGAAAVASPHVYAISKRAQQVFETASPPRSEYVPVTPIPPISPIPLFAPLVSP